MVDRARGLHHERPAGGHNDFGDHIWHEDQHANQRTSAHAAIEHERNPHRGGSLQNQRHYDDEAVVLQRVLERGVLQNHQVVLQPDEVGGYSISFPFEEPVIGGHHHRENHKSQEDDDRWSG